VLSLHNFRLSILKDYISIFIGILSEPFFDDFFGLKGGLGSFKNCVIDLLRELKSVNLAEDKDIFMTWFILAKFLKLLETGSSGCFCLTDSRILFLLAYPERFNLRSFIGVLS
jgi:hypothetical protein